MSPRANTRVKTCVRSFWQAECELIRGLKRRLNRCQGKKMLTARQPIGKQMASLQAIVTRRRWRRMRAPSCMEVAARRTIVPPAAQTRPHARSICSDTVGLATALAPAEVTKGGALSVTYEAEFLEGAVCPPSRFTVPAAEFHPNGVSVFPILVFGNCRGG